jgi:hypothetical protein
MYCPVDEMEEQLIFAVIPDKVGMVYVVSAALE